MTVHLQNQSGWVVASLLALAFLGLAVLSSCASPTPAAPPVSAGKPTFIFFYRDA